MSQGRKSGSEEKLKRVVGNEWRGGNEKVDSYLGYLSFNSGVGRGQGDESFLVNSSGT